MQRYNQKTPFRNTGGYSIESYEPENQEEEKKLNQTYLTPYLPKMQNSPNNMSLNFGNVTQYNNPYINNRDLTNIRYLTKQNTINVYNSANISYSLNYNNIQATNPLSSLNTIKGNPVIYPYNQKTKIVYPIRTLDTLNYGKKYNVPQVNFTRIPEPVIRSKTSKFLPINKYPQYINKPTSKTNMPINIKVVQPSITTIKYPFNMNPLNPIYQNIIIRKRNII